MDLEAPRWRGQPGRLEVWYATLTDRSTGAGLWLHREVVAPVEGAGEPYEHGWTAWFPQDGAPVLERSERRPVDPSAGWPLEGLVVDDPGAAPIWTFPRAAWEREVLPGAQVVAMPSAPARGVVAGHEVEGTIALARIYGHGNAERWGWLHADLGRGDVCEVVTAVSRRGGLRRLPPAAFVRFRLGGRDLPLAAARTSLGLPRWSVTGWIGRRRLRIEVDIPPERAVAVEYVDPDGPGPTCTNSEIADARIVLGERSWQLDGTAHAEVGRRH